MVEYEIIVWFVLIIVAALVEMNTMDLTSIWFSAGALFAFILAIAGAALWIQVSVFVVTSLMLIALVRPITKKYLKTNVVHTNTDRLVGKVAYWMAVTTSEEDIDVDEKVEVLAVEGVKLVVDRIK